LNAAQIATNARKARKALDNAMSRFDSKMMAMHKEAVQGRSKLARASASMNAKIRAMVQGRVRKITARTSAAFARVRSRMAKDRHHADMMLAHAARRLNSALSATKLLQSKRFAKTVKNIKSARKEAAARVNEARKEFKMNTMRLASVVKHQVGKLNTRVSTLQGVITKNALEQAKVNRNVNAELKRMVKIGNEREAKLHKNDKVLGKMMKKNAAEVNRRIHNLQKRFNERVAAIRKQMARDRKFHAHALSTTTEKLYKVLYKNKVKQAKVNHKLQTATFAARVEAASALRSAQTSFSKRIATLGNVVKLNERKVNRKIEKLTGVVDKHAVKDAKGRALLRMRSQSNRRELDAAIRNAIAKGERHAQRVEQNTVKMNKKTRAQLNSQISTSIGILSKRIKRDISDLAEENKKARKQLKVSIMYALNQAAAEAKKNLKMMVEWSMKKFMALEKQHAKNMKTGASGRAGLKASVAANHKFMKRAVQDAVLAQAKALMTLKSQTNMKIKKTNKDVTAAGRLMIKNANEVKAKMAANEGALKAKIAQARSQNKAQLKATNKASIKRKLGALRMINTGLAKAKKRMDTTFIKVYAQMGKDRSEVSSALAGATKSLNDALAKNIALSDARFRKTVKDITAAKAAATAQVAAAKKAYLTRFLLLGSVLRQQEKKLVGEVGVVSDMLTRHRKQQAKVNKRVASGIKRIQNLSNMRYSESKRARGKIKILMDQNKKIAQQEVKALTASAALRLSKLRKYQDRLAVDAQKNLARATQQVNIRIRVQQDNQFKKQLALKKSLKVTKASASAALKSAKEDFKSKLVSLTNTVTSNRKNFEKRLRHITGVAHNWKATSAADRANIRSEVKAMNADLRSKLTTAIQQGIQRANRVERDANTKIKATTKALRVEIVARVERMADNVFKSMNKSRQAIANNYLSLKGYCGAAHHAIVKYQQGKHGKSLSSIGDFMQQVAFNSKIKTKPEAGVANGAKAIKSPFSGKSIKALHSLSKVNGLVHEYTQLYTVVQQRWTMGLGKYLMDKLAMSMQKKGVLHVTSKAGAKHVCVSGTTLGLSSQVRTFKSLAVKMGKYQSFLRNLAAKLPKRSIEKPVTMPPPEWQGK